MSYSNDHSLYITFGHANEKQIRFALATAVTEAEAKLRRKLACEFIINVVTTRDNKPVGYSFVWVTNPEVYYILIGRNPDGSERYELIDDPHWVEPETNDDEETSSKSWADEVEGLSLCPKIRRLLPPIATLPRYNHTKEQLELVRNDLQLDPLRANEEPDREGSFKIYASNVEVVPEDLDPFTLSTKIPPWVTERGLKAKLDVFSSNKTSIKGRQIYPKVIINSNGWTIVAFDKGVTDAQFALQMLRKMTYTQGKESTTLCFRHASQRRQR